MKGEDIQTLRALVAARSGVQVDPDKLYLIESRLAPVARREGFATLPEMIQAVRAHRDERLMWALAEAMTPTETAFFRDREPFESFREDMLPQLAQARAGAPIRVWSAACSTGQEAYSLAMAVDEARSRLPGVRVDLFGSDLSERCLEKAQAGLYTQFEVQRGLPIRLLVRHFEKAGDNWALSPRIRQMVRWRRINLLADLRSLGRFDVIFCRNAVCYFDDAARKRVLEQLAALLSDDGYLVLGQGETAMAATDALEPVAGRPGLYRRNPQARAAA